MCGFAGVELLPEESGIDLKGPLEAMLDQMESRGPDDRGTFHHEQLALGHRRLSILDTSENGHQPMTDGSGRYVIAYNGEVYDHMDLRKPSEKDYRSGTDTESIVEAWAEEGPSILSRMNGMFAFALKDLDRNRLYLCRDRMGIKPLYYSITPKGIVFGSSVMALAKSGLIPPSLDKESLQEYVQYQTVSSERTLLSGVFSVPPGHYLLWDEGEVSIKAWWQLHPEGGMLEDLDFAKNRIRELLSDSVEKRLLSDVPLGAFLSGGIDSSLVVALMAKGSEDAVNTFSVVFDESEYSEAPYAEAVANKYGTLHTPILLDPSEMLYSLPDILDSYDHPSGDGANTYVVSREVKRQGITVALSGLGGDELFAGYPVFRQLPEFVNKGWLFSFPKQIRSMVGQMLYRKNPGMQTRKMWELLRQDYGRAEYFYPFSRMSLLPKEAKLAMPSIDTGHNPVFSQCKETAELYDSFRQGRMLSMTSLLEFQQYLEPVLLRDTDQMSMAHSLEVRVPFLDHRLVELAISCSDRIKYPHSPKQLLVDSFPDLLPLDIVNRPKQGFLLPFEQWMKAELKQTCEEGLDLLKGCHGFSEKGLEELWRRFMAGDPLVSWSRIWHLVVLSRWIKNIGIEG